MMSGISAGAETLRLEKIKYGDMNSWVTRTVGESRVIGGNKRTIYEIGPNTTIAGENKAYVPLGGSPWGTSNVYAHVSGIHKGSNAVYPDVRSGADRCAKLTSKIETLKVLGLINLDVMVSGSIFLGRMIEPITSTKNPYSKMEMGVPYTKRPKALVFDYKVDMPEALTRTKATGFGGKKTLPGRDAAVVFVFCSVAGKIPRAISTQSALLQVASVSKWVAGGKTAIRFHSIMATIRRSPDIRNG